MLEREVASFHLLASQKIIMMSALNFLDADRSYFSPLQGPCALPGSSMAS
jgi:hypothetical protein